MKKRVFILFSLLIPALSFGQTELVNVFTKKSSMSGGTEMSGTSTSLSYMFVSQTKLKMVNVYLDDKQLEMRANDTLVIHLITHSSYNLYEQEAIEPKAKKSFNCYYQNGIYYVSINLEKEFQYAARYEVGGNHHIAMRKENIDSTEEHFAP